MPTITCTAVIQKAAVFIYSFIYLFSHCAVIKSYLNVFFGPSDFSQCRFAGAAHARADT